MDTLLHIRVGKRIREEMQQLLDAGLFTNQAEMVREGVRDILVKYQHHLGRGK
ncbi:hypothetical protein HYU13_03060 [Candidatus Woesearchaeota archaeon]|nr:hypothetical protein [Candidatus Woesearchaeota archaeon]